MPETKPRTKDCVKPSFVKANKLAFHIHYVDFVLPFIPFKNNPHSMKSVDYPQFQLWTKWKNLKAALMGVGEGGTTYSDWKPFTSRKLRQRFYIYINGLSPSPTIERKFKPQSEDPVHGNDFIYHSFGPNATRCHRHFNTFLGVQDPATQNPPRTKYPNGKIRPLLKWTS